MTRFLPLLMALWPTFAAAQVNVELYLYGAMLEGPSGVPLASATGVAGSNGTVEYVTGAEAGATQGACLRIWAEGSCFPVEAATPLPNLDGLAVVRAQIPEQEFSNKLTRFPITRQPLVGVFDPASDGGLSFVTQNALGGWQEPINPAQVSGRAGGAVILSNDGFSSFSVGAPLVHAEKGLVGIVSRANAGAATLMPMTDLVAALDAVGVDVPPTLRPATQTDGGLPPRVESETGRIIVFGDYSYIGYLGGFYGPSGGAGFDASFVTSIAYSVWEIDPTTGGARRIAAADKVLPLLPSGQSLEADFSATPGDHLVTCVSHTTPTSPDRAVVVLQFWRVAPERYAAAIDDKAFDEAAPPLTGWAEGAAPCQAAIAGVDADRRAALAGQTPVPTAPDLAPSAAPSAAPPAQPGNGWSALEPWDETGYFGVTQILPSGASLTLGCTGLGELAIAVSPTPRTIGFALGDAGPMLTGATETAAFAFLPGDLTGSLRAVIDDQTMTLALPTGLLPCRKQ